MSLRAYQVPAFEVSDLIFVVRCVKIIAAQYMTFSTSLLILSTVAIDIAAVTWVQMVFISLGFYRSWPLKAQNAVLPQHLAI